ncbi:PEP-CTERM sorting domain-containing protein [Tundrisphaera sp. TA3]|uniref:PEP-CTERM sorting domain-containing protein n=1 Tax=Tundrisphaera sp. TA3 TaxID=3435775 RepID=UPI003EBB320F
MVATLGMIAWSTGRAEASFVTVAFSYNLRDGQSISGTVSGDLQQDDDTVINLTGLNAIYSGRPATPLGFTVDYASFLSLSGNQEFVLLGLASDPKTSSLTSNFGFALSNNPNIINPVVVGTFTTNSGSVSFPSPDDVVQQELFFPGSYSARIIPNAVPEPASLAMCGVAGIAGLGAWARRRRVA